MEIFFKKLIANIAFLIMRVLDGFFSLFKVYSGLEEIAVRENEDGLVSKNLLTYFTENNVVAQAFYWILLISIALLAMFTFAGRFPNYAIFWKFPPTTF